MAFRFSKLTAAHYLIMTVIYSFLVYVGLELAKFYGVLDYGESIITRTKATLIRVDER
jgi:hypothetical protein